MPLNAIPNPNFNPANPVFCSTCEKWFDNHKKYTKHCKTSKVHKVCLKK